MLRAASRITSLLTRPITPNIAPVYPAELSTFLAGISPGREMVWDCGTGSGQAAVVLAADFERVVATDASAAQLAHAREHPRVEYRAGARTGLGASDRNRATS